MDKDVKKITITKSNHGFILEILYTNDKHATLSIDSFNLSDVYETIARQNTEVHRAVD